MKPEQLISLRLTRARAERLRYLIDLAAEMAEDEYHPDSEVSVLVQSLNGESQMDICEFSEAVVAALEGVGYRVHEPNAEVDGFWWTLTRPGARDETSEPFASAYGAWASAVEHMATLAAQNLDAIVVGS